MVARVGSTDSWRIFAGLSRGFKLVCADPSSGCCVASHGLEVKSQLTDVARQLADRCGAGAPSAGGSNTTGVARVPDVGVVGGEGGATGGGGDDTAVTQPIGKIFVRSITSNVTTLKFLIE